MQLASPRRSLPHQTGVTERSIGDGDRHLSHRVVQDVMVGHLHDWISPPFPPDSHRHHHFVISEVDGGSLEKPPAPDRLEHPSKVVMPSHYSRPPAHHQ